MRVLYSGTVDVGAGGLATGIYYTMLGVREQGIEAEIFMFRSGDKLVGEEIPIHYSARPIIPKIAYSPSYKRDLRELGEYDIYHAQGIWQLPTYTFVDMARSLKKAYVITPHGMLYPQDIAKSSTLFKQLSLRLRLIDDLNGADCIQVTCEQELEHCRDLGIKSPIAIIPNPVEIEDLPQNRSNSTFRVGYLGRLSPRKNVEGLIYAFDALRIELRDAELLIIGGGDADYETFLRNEVKRLGLKNVRFTGFITGDEKSRAIASLSLLAMPSEFENHGIVILEALMRGIPCIATKGAPWEELNSYRCGWWVEYNQDAITAAVAEAFYTPESELRAMGERGRRLIRQRYSVEAIGIKMRALYEWILGANKKPDFVYE